MPLIAKIRSKIDAVDDSWIKVWENMKVWVMGEGLVLARVYGGWNVDDM